MYHVFNEQSRGNYSNKVLVCLPLTSLYRYNEWLPYFRRTKLFDQQHRTTYNITVIFHYNMFVLSNEKRSRLSNRNGRFCTIVIPLNPNLTYNMWRIGQICAQYTFSIKPKIARYFNRISIAVH